MHHYLFLNHTLQSSSQNREYRVFRKLLSFFTATTTTSTTTTVNTVTSCIFPCLCSGMASYTMWQPYPNIGIYMTINTTNCNFNQTPAYFTSMGGIGSHNFLSGYTAIYAASNTAFTVYAMSVLSWNTSTLLNLASSNAWDLYWFGLYY